MQTFLPYPSYAESAKTLDLRRLGKQRLEVFQILQALTHTEGGWRSHPASQAWRHNIVALRRYLRVVVDEWTGRGYHDGIWQDVAQRWSHMQRGALYDQLVGDPWWLGLPAYHAAHRSNLVRKKAEHYGPLFDEPAGLPYVWPKARVNKRTLVVGERRPDIHDERGAFEPKHLDRLETLGFDLTDADTVNLLPGSSDVGAWDLVDARHNAKAVMQDALFGADAPGYNRVLLCGVRVPAALGLARGLLSTAELFDVVFFVVPHPSGLNRWWNDKENVARATEIFEHGRSVSQLRVTKPPPKRSRVRL